MARIGFIILTVFWIYYVSAVQLPSYIKLCHKKDPNLSQCFINNANEALPKITEGNKELGQVPLNPFVIPKLELNGGNNFVLAFHQLKTYGLEKTSLQNGTTIDLEKGSAVCKAKVPLLIFDGDYEINGKILVLPISGKGKGVIKYHETEWVLSVQFNYEDQGGKKFIKIEETKLDYKLSKAEFDFENLFNGDEKLGNEMNKVINENWQVVEGDLHEAAAEVMRATAHLLITNHFTKVPFDSIFPE